MNGKTEIGTEWMRRMIALLFSLADMAEHASVRSWRVRRDLLALLRRAEAASFWTVADAARDCGAPLPVQAMAAGRHWKFDDDGDTPENALRLAHRFRALAVALACLLAMAGRQATPELERSPERKAGAVSGSPGLSKAAAWRATAIRAPPGAAA